MIDSKKDDQQQPVENPKRGAGQPRKYPDGGRQKAWKKRTGFASSEQQKEYRREYARADRAKKKAQREKDGIKLEPKTAATPQAVPCDCKGTIKMIGGFQTGRKGFEGTFMYRRHQCGTCSHRWSTWEPIEGDSQLDKLT